MTHTEIALSQMRIKEIKGLEDNPEVLKYFEALGLDSTKLKDETAWCSAFANWVACEADLEGSGELTARSWLKVGQPVEDPKLGDVVVLWRESPESWKGHVGFFIREDKNWIWILGGNQNNEVNVSAYPKTRLLEYRRIDHV